LKEKVHSIHSCIIYGEAYSLITHNYSCAINAIKECIIRSASANSLN